MDKLGNRNCSSTNAKPFEGVVDSAERGGSLLSPDGAKVAVRNTVRLSRPGTERDKSRPSRRLRAFATPDDCEWVIARGEADAFRVREEHTGEPSDAWSMCFWRELAPDEKLTIWANCETGKVTMVDDPDGGPVTLTCAEWIKRQGRGWLATTEGS